MNLLSQLAYKYGSDKCPQISHFYTDFYYKTFEGKRNSIRKLLEIGVGYKEVMKGSPPHYKNGASLFMWRDFFPKAKMYGIDINKDIIFKDGRIQTFYCDQSDPVQLTRLIDKIGSDLDIVIDDGSHNPKDIVISCLTFMPLLKKDVIYIIEDTNIDNATTVMGALKNYICHPVRRSKMRFRDDRLIVVTNKNG